MDSINFRKELETATVKIEFGGITFGLLTRDGIEFVVGHRATSRKSRDEWWANACFLPMPTSEMRLDAEVKTMVENALQKDIEEGNEHRIDAIVLGADAAFCAFGEGLIVDNRIDTVDGQFIGRLLALGRVWKFIVQLNNSIVPNSFSVATVDSDLRNIS